VLGAPGCARDLEQDVVERKQELAYRRRAWLSRRSSGRGGARGGCRGETAQGREGGGKAGK
jgi:hypothetical protein